MLQVPTRVFVLTTAIGIVPGSFVFVGLGNGLGHILEAGELPGLAVFAAPEVLMPLVLLAALSASPILYKRRRGAPGTVRNDTSESRHLCHRWRFGRPVGGRRRGPMGASVALFERGAMGGDCLNHGCVPSKALLAAAKAAASVAGAGAFGVDAELTAIDRRRVAAHVRGVIAAIAPHDSVARFTGLGVR